MLSIRVAGATLAMVLAGALAPLRAIPADVPPPPPHDSGRPRLLMVYFVGDSVDFVLTDPAGRSGVVAVDRATCSILGCDIDKSSELAMEDHDDSDTTSADTAQRVYEAYGGGHIVLDDPEPGTWSIEAYTNRECPDSCGTEIDVMHIGEETMDVSLSVHAMLERGERMRWELVIAPRSERIGKPWAWMTEVARAKGKRWRGEHVSPRSSAASPR